MKNFRLIILAVIAAGISFAFTKPAAKTKVVANLHWFAPGDVYIGSRTIAQQEMLCAGITAACAKGYSSITGLPPQPVGPVVYIAEKDP